MLARRSHVTEHTTMRTSKNAESSILSNNKPTTNHGVNSNQQHAMNALDVERSNIASCNGTHDMANWHTRNRQSRVCERQAGSYLTERRIYWRSTCGRSRRSSRIPGFYSRKHPGFGQNRCVPELRNCIDRRGVPDPAGAIVRPSITVEPSSARSREAGQPREW